MCIVNQINKKIPEGYPGGAGCPGGMFDGLYICGYTWFWGGGYWGFPPYGSVICFELLSFKYKIRIILK